ncbi:MAG: type II toxin-antitoxin system prevent-host-death family antitoxin [Alcaligenaceae bacterium]|nr:type II toxin-antitoxin system prevent-host-death family antitoxin [Alcaligenaceae bacterium]
MLPKRPINRITTTAFKAQTAKILQQLNQQQEPIELTHNGTVQAVLLPAAEYPPYSSADIDHKRGN